jgi:hypothetical protein
MPGLGSRRWYTLGVQPARHALERIAIHVQLEDVPNDAAKLYGAAVRRDLALHRLRTAVEEGRQKAAEALEAAAEAREEREQKRAIAYRNAGLLRSRSGERQ